MIPFSSVRSLMEAKGGGKGFVPWFTHAVGLTDANGNKYLDQAGNQTLRDPAGTKRLTPTEFSLGHLGRGIVGHEMFESFYNPDSNKLQGLRRIMEAGEGAVNASAFANINAFTAVVAGLMEVAILEKYIAPEFITDRIFPAVPSRMFEGRKSIGTMNIGDKAEQREPGMPTKRVQFGERWISQPRTVENALAVEVTQEAAFLDLTGQVIEEANNLGYWLGYRKELRGIDALLGVTNTYNYKGTSYNTWISAGYYDNKLTGNALLHWTNIKNAWLKMQLATDPDTGVYAGGFIPDSIVTVPQLYLDATAITGAERVQYRDASTSASNIREFANPVGGWIKNVVQSPLIYQRATAADGLNLSADDAASLWFTMQSGKFGQYVQNQPLRVQQGVPGQTEMIDRGVVLFVKADERGQFWVTQPRAGVYNQR